jgi:hypothetical protein
MPMPNGGPPAIGAMRWPAAGCSGWCIHGTCGEALLDTYSPERSYVGARWAMNMRGVASEKYGGGMKPGCRTPSTLRGNWLWPLGFAPVRHAFADQMSQVSVGYPESPMNGPRHDLADNIAEVLRDGIAQGANCDEVLKPTARLTAPPTITCDFARIDSEGTICR